ncbi:hypothetical protein [Haloglomus litoreum]|uniref:hypothetical protein n=1 Tax=Haloglomus litoreum TaxID=3034026 RepID=UPI0023E83370|nr:hypothetical protein [Haloglomus sp. DT116]
MSGQSPDNNPRRIIRAGGPPALITAAIGVGATGIVGPEIESETEPVATGLARALGLDPGLGPALLLALAVLVLGVAFVVPGLFEEAP